MPLRNTCQLLFIFILVAVSLHAQVGDSLKQREVFVEKYPCLLAGYSLGAYSYAEIGFARLKNTKVGHHPFSSAYFASTEIMLGNKFILGPKIGYWMAGGAGGVAIGVNMIYYTNIDKACLVFRPEIGFGFQQFKLVYGYNANLTKYRLDRINKNLVGLTYCFKLKRLKEKMDEQ